MLKMLVVILIGGSLSAALLGAAASLTVNGGALQAGTDATLECDSTGVTLEFNNTDTDASDAETVTIKNIHDNCVGATAYVTIAAVSTTCGVIAANGPGADDNTINCDPTPDVPVSTTSVTVQIIGGGSTPP
jgi:hypothetical protein